MDNKQLGFDDFIVDDAFSYEGYQIVRGEFFSHINEPSLTFNNYKISVNTACIKKLPMVRYIQIMVNPKDKKLVVFPCDEDAKDSLQWCTENNGKRRPRQITCRFFFAKIAELMNWSPDYRYKLLGKIIRSNDTYLVVFDLSSAEMYCREINSENTAQDRRTPIFPKEWKNQFGLPLEEHKRFTQVNVFDGYTVFSVSDRKNKINKEEH